MTESNSARRLTVHIDGEDWKEIGSLSHAAADDTVFVFDAATGRAIFGDGTHGRRPPDDSVVTISYHEGGGAEGNIGVSITTRWPAANRRYVVALSSAGIGIGQIGAGVERFAGAKRPTYFTGQLLSASDFQAEQQYSIGRRYLHNRLLHGSGVASGLSVTTAVSGSSTVIVVEPGLALDRHGREIDLDAPVTLPLGEPGCHWYVIGEYAEREADPVSSTAGMVASRIEEGASIRLSHEAVTDDGVVLARLVHDSTGWKVDGAFAPERCNRSTRITS